MLNQILASLSNADCFRLNSFPATIGRSGEADLSIEDRFVSREQCLVERVDDQFVVSDLDSRHGTFLNGEKVDRDTLRSGDLLQLGLLLFRVNRLGDKLLFRAVRGIPTNVSQALPQQEIDGESASGLIKLV